jgi:hypothetical protein
MRAFLRLGLLCGSITACGSSGAAGPTTVHIATTLIAPQLVVFREGVDGPWQSATTKTPTSFEIVVQHPYVVSVVCAESLFDPVNLSQIARTPDDSHDISVRCGSLDDVHQLTGKMVQAGQLTLGSEATRSARPDWDFLLVAPPGTYDLVARSDAQILVRRGIAVGADDVALGLIDLAQGGTAFDTVAVNVTNAAADEMLTAAAYLENPTLQLAAELPVGPVSAVKVAPPSLLIPGDKQTLAVRASKGPMTRSLQRPLTTGGSATYTLPAAVGDLQWKLDGGRLTASWTSLPEHDELAMLAFVGGGGRRQRTYTLVASAQFVAATGVEQLGFDPEIPGYRAEWKIDFASSYQRDFGARRVQGDATAVTSDDEIIP